MADVFVSYSRRDSDFVGRLAEALRARGKDVWVDVEGIRDAEVFPAALRTAVEGADGFVFVISPDSVASSFCEQEVEHALELNKRIVPAVVRRVPDEDMPEEIRHRNWIPFDDGEDFDGGVDRVAHALDTDLEYARQHTRWLLKALEWEAEERDRSFLLRGAELSAAESWLGGSAGKDPEPTALQQEYVFASRAGASRRQRVVVSASLVVAAVSVGLLIFALISRHQARSGRITASSRALAAQSANQLSVDPELAVLLGTEAVRAKSTPEAMLALRQAIDRDPLRMTLARLPRQECVIGLGPAPAYSPDGRMLAETSCDGRVLILDAQTGRRLRQVHLRGEAEDASYTPDGRTLAVGTTAGIQLLDARTGQPRRILSGGGGVSQLAVSPDGRELAAATNNGLRIWDLPTGRARVLSRRAQQWWAVAFARGGTRLLAGASQGNGGALGSAYLFDTRSGRRLEKLPGSHSVDDFAVSPDGSQLAVVDSDQAHGGTGNVALWSTRTWRRTATIARFPALEVTRVAFSPDGRELAIGAADGTAGMWQTTGDHVQVQSFLGHTAAIAGLVFRPSRRELATTSIDGNARVWRTGGRERLDLHPGSAAFALLDRDRLVALTDRGRVASFSLPEGRPAGSFDVPAGPTIPPPALSHDGSIALAFPIGQVDLWSVSRRQVLEHVRGISRFEVADLTPDDRRLVILRMDPGRPFGIVVDLRTGRRRPLAGPLPTTTPSWRSTDFTAEGRLMAAGSFDGAVVLWDPVTGRKVGAFTNRGQVSGVSFSHDGRLLAVGSWDGTVTIWDVEARRALRVLHGPTRGVTGTVFSRRGDWLAAGSLDHTVTLWDTRTWKITRVLAHPDVALASGFSMDGQRLVTGDGSGTLRLWDTCPGCRDPKALLAQARNTVTRRLTAEERTTFLAGL